MFPNEKLRDANLWISTVLQGVLNIGLIFLALTLCFLLGRELVYFIYSSLLIKSGMSHSQLLEPILIFFLYFEFIALIVKYFKEHHHFPIRYFLYIGITAMIRLIIVNHDNAVYTLLYSGAILILIVGYFIMNSVTARKGRL